MTIMIILLGALGIYLSLSIYSTYPKHCAIRPILLGGLPRKSIVHTVAISLYDLSVGRLVGF